MGDSPVRLLVTDLDGTLIGGGNENVFLPEFINRLQQFRERYDTQWAICTGRSLSSVKSVLEPIRAMGIEPGYVIVRHAFLYQLRGREYWPYVFWNFLISFQILEGALYLRSELKKWCQQVRRMVKFSKIINNSQNRLCLRFQNEADVEMATDLLRKNANVCKRLQVSRDMLKIEVRKVPFTKGMAVSELARHLGFNRSEILTVGDGHNDISMLDGVSAASCGCPSNAKAEVMDVVHLVGGHVASKPRLEGVVEIMDAYLTGVINSALPECWTSNRHQLNSKSAVRRLQHRHHHRRSNLPRIPLRILILGIYTVLLVFANFGLLPFSNWILKPFTWVSLLVEKILTLFSI